MSRGRLKEQNLEVKDVSDIQEKLQAPYIISAIKTLIHSHTH